MESEGMQEVCEGDTRRRNLWKRDAKKDQPAEDKVHSYQRADESYDDTSVERVPEQEFGTEHFLDEVHVRCLPKSAFLRSSLC